MRTLTVAAAVLAATIGISSAQQSELIRRGPEERRPVLHAQAQQPQTQPAQPQVCNAKVHQLLQGFQQAKVQSLKELKETVILAEIRKADSCVYDLGDGELKKFESEDVTKEILSAMRQRLSPATRAAETAPAPQNRSVATCDPSRVYVNPKYKKEEKHGALSDMAANRAYLHLMVHNPYRDKVVGPVTDPLSGSQAMVIDELCPLQTVTITYTTSNFNLKTPTEVEFIAVMRDVGDTDGSTRESVPSPRFPIGRLVGYNYSGRPIFESNSARWDVGIQARPEERLMSRGHDEYGQGHVHPGAGGMPPVAVVAGPGSGFDPNCYNSGYWHQYYVNEGHVSCPLCWSRNRRAMISTGPIRYCSMYDNTCLMAGGIPYGTPVGGYYGNYGGYYGGYPPVRSGVSVGVGVSVGFGGGRNYYGNQGVALRQPVVARQPVVVRQHVYRRIPRPCGGPSIFPQADCR